MQPERMLKKFWSFLSPYGVFWESQKPSTTRATLGYYFDRLKYQENRVSLTELLKDLEGFVLFMLGVGDYGIHCGSCYACSRRLLLEEPETILEDPNYEHPYAKCGSLKSVLYS
ncbi:hypothetical protein H5410_031648 [Solanum commersonii]|uniref:Uncharacterized protein n=1 Tax=Solanum commersonii TaxID=4109 RepID=A0A9J5YMZ2_SOLCO|nr:hypothetical protein H5410_031648 [Solanum commersonii]